MLIYLSILENEEDKQSFQQIYEENHLKMYHVAFHILNHQMDAENVVHDAFLKLAEHFEKYRKLPQKEMTALCVHITKNKAIDIVRRVSHLSREEVENLVLVDEQRERQPQVYLEQTEEQKQIRSILEKLPEILKITLELKYYYEFNNREIAQTLGVTTKTVEMRLYRGKIKLRELLENEGIIE